MARTLELNFVTDIGKAARLTVESPKEPIDPAHVKLAMEQIISSGAFYSANGNLASVAGARVVERNVTQYELV